MPAMFKSVKWSQRMEPTLLVHRDNAIDGGGGLATAEAVGSVDEVDPIVRCLRLDRDRVLHRHAARRPFCDSNPGVHTRASAKRSARRVVVCAPRGMGR